MRVADIRARAADISPAEGGDAQRVAGGETAQAFGRQLMGAGTDAYRGRIAELVDGITRQGKVLSERTDICEFVKYRELISGLMREVVNNAYAFSKQNTFDARGRHRIYAVVHKVNAKLDELARDVLAEQQDNLRILEDIEDIRGLLVDMLL